MIIRYTKATKAAADQPVKSSTLKGKDKQHLVFDLTLTNQIAKNTNQDIFKWEGSGVIEAIASFWLTTQAGALIIPVGHTVTFANNTVNIAIANGENDQAIAANSKLVLSLIIGQKSVTR